MTVTPRMTLRIVRSSSREKLDLLAARVAELSSLGFQVLHDELPPDASWRYTSASIPDRAKALMDALTEPTSQAVLCARGGYGANDLLPVLDWDRLKTAKPKLLVGFSDTSALHSALYARFGWVGLHAPMPATVLWRQDGRGDDVDELLGILKDMHAGKAISASLPLTAISDTAKAATTISGRLFGGCFTVLSALIGTPYFPKSLAGHIVFLEDTDENPGRLMRNLNQWQQAGHLQGVKAIVLGHLRGLGGDVPDSAPFVLEQFAKRLPGVAIFHSPLFGHTSPNHPLMVGAEANIQHSKLTWRYGHDNRSV